ncbi:MAG: hypothetical protein EOP84_13365 [Verrucomicrobiaceae bacterium]|nr:MAG: hypothetical protein EOP84_13365 [Verrucomicrobiaceae bacterium]
MKRKTELVNGSTMKRLNRLAEVESLGHSKLDAIFDKIERLVPYKGVSDEVLLKSSTSLNPDGFDPRTDATEEGAAEQLAKAEAETHALFDSWQSQLLKELGTNDPSVQGGFSALAQEDRKRIDAFLSSKALPDEIDTAFVLAVNNLLKGLRKKPIKLESFGNAIFGDGVPLKPDELLQRVQDWVKLQTQNEDEKQVRFVMEQ